MVQTGPNAELMRKPEWKNLPYYLILSMIIIIVINLKAGLACDLISFSPHADADDSANKTMMVVITKKMMMMIMMMMMMMMIL